MRAKLSIKLRVMRWNCEIKIYYSQIIAAILFALSTIDL